MILSYNHYTYIIKGLSFFLKGLSYHFSISPTSDELKYKNILDLDIKSPGDSPGDAVFIEFQSSLFYKAHSRTARAVTEKPCLKKNKKNKTQTTTTKKNLGD